MSLRRPARGLTLLALLTVLGCFLLQASLAQAHQGDPRIVTRVERVTPALPTGVVVEARAGLAAQLVAANPTATPLEVLARGGESFLRISSAGVLANLESPDFYETANPNGSTAGVPARVKAAGGRGTPRFVLLSRGSSWGWYDHRLHPRTYAAPGAEDRPATLATFSVPLRYGAMPVTATGTVAFVPVRGTFQVDTREVPAGLTAEVLQGRLPGLLLSVADGAAVSVLGREGEPFLRFGPAGAEVNEASRTHVEDRQARGDEDIAPPGGAPRWKVVGGTSYSWLDGRLGYTSELPPEPALRATVPTEVQTWSIPLRVGDKELALTGAIRWIPIVAADRGVDEPARTGRSFAVLGLAGAAGVLLVGTLMALRLRRRRV